MLILGRSNSGIERGERAFHGSCADLEGYSLVERHADGCQEAMLLHFLAVMITSLEE